MPIAFGKNMRNKLRNEVAGQEQPTQSGGTSKLGQMVARSRSRVQARSSAPEAVAPQQAPINAVGGMFANAQASAGDAMGKVAFGQGTDQGNAPGGFVDGPSDVPVQRGNGCTNHQ